MSKNDKENKNEQDPKAHEPKVSDAQKAAQNKKSEAACKEGIFQEAVKLYRKETPGVVQLLAYVEQLDKLGKLPKEKEDEE